MQARQVVIQCALAICAQCRVAMYIIHCTRTATLMKQHVLQCLYSTARLMKQFAIAKLLCMTHSELHGKQHVKSHRNCVLQRTQ